MSCPGDEDLTEALERAAEVLPGFDATAPLVVEWHADGEVFGALPDGTRVVGVSRSPHETRVSSWRLLAHEIVHIHLWRTTGNPDSAHRSDVWASVEPRLKAALGGGP